MPKILTKTRKLDLNNFFGEEAWLTLKYINREDWRAINRLTLCLAESQAFIDLQKDKKYLDLQKKLQKATESKEIKEITEELNKIQTELLLENYKKIDSDKMQNLKKIEAERNKMLIDMGVDKELHNFYNEKGEKLVLNYEILRNCEFFDYLLQEIINFNAEFDLLERK